jgi:BioD-like phosphotransacetylase family protein
MKTILIGSTETFSGKSAVTLGLGTVLKEKGYKVGFMKPLGNLLKMENGRIIDEDAYNIKEILGITDSLDDITPIHLTDDFLHKILKGEVCGLNQSIKSAFASISQEKDVVLVEGNANFSGGAIYQMTDADMAHVLDASILLVVRYRSEKDIDGILIDYKIIGDPEMIIGVILNDVPDEEISDVEHVVKPYLSRLGINVLGVIPRDYTLKSSSVGEIAEMLGGNILTAQEKTEELIEHVLVGAMEAESALVFFRRGHNYAVVTGGDRADIQLTAIKANARCLILTGNLYPSPAVLGSAQKKGVPMILVSTDTMTTIDRIEQIMGRSSMGNPAKLKRIVELIKDNLDLGAIVRYIE